MKPGTINDTFGNNFIWKEGGVQCLNLGKGESDGPFQKGSTSLGPRITRGLISHFTLEGKDCNEFGRDAN